MITAHILIFAIALIPWFVHFFSRSMPRSPIGFKRYGEDFNNPMYCPSWILFCNLSISVSEVCLLDLQSFDYQNPDALAPHWVLCINASKAYEMEKAAKVFAVMTGYYTLAVATFGYWIEVAEDIDVNDTIKKIGKHALILPRLLFFK